MTQSTLTKQEDFSTEEIVEFYNDTAWEYKVFWSDFNLHYGFYDEDHTSHEEAMVNSNRIYAEKLGAERTDTVLDVGTGRGGLPIWIAEHVGADVHGIDIDRRHVDEAEANARRRGVASNTDFEVANFLDVPYPDSTFDALSGIETVCHTKRKKDFLREARRVLKPGGKLLLSDGFVNQYDLTTDEEKTMRTLADGWAVPRFAHVADFRAHLEDLGFTNVDFDNHRDYILPSSRRQLFLSIAITPLLKVASALGIKDESSVKQGIALYHQYDAIKSGLAVHGDFTATLGT
ncbi:ubiquinone biosynthesis methyltransferase UbiE [halophilic archaeon]|nr:ubiquinone biosynthesis methyltransferase UbiE [halophilic archaeon]